MKKKNFPALTLIPTLSLSLTHTHTHWHILSTHAHAYIQTNSLTKACCSISLLSYHAEFRGCCKIFFVEQARNFAPNWICRISSLCQMSEIFFHSFVTKQCQLIFINPGQLFHAYTHICADTHTWNSSYFTTLSVFKTAFHSLSHTPSHSLLLINKQPTHFHTNIHSISLTIPHSNSLALTNTLALTRSHTLTLNTYLTHPHSLAPTRWPFFSQWHSSIFSNHKTSAWDLTWCDADVDDADVVDNFAFSRRHFVSAISSSCDATPLSEPSDALRVNFCVKQFETVENIKSSCGCGTAVELKGHDQEGYLILWFGRHP